MLEGLGEGTVKLLARALQIRVFSLLRAEIILQEIKVPAHSGHAN
jgi:hypothetical protein